MTIVTKKDITRRMKISLFAGISAVWLTFVWATFGGSFAESADEIFDIEWIHLYFAFNTLLMLLSAFTLSNRQFRAFALLSLILGFSVTASAFIYIEEFNLFMFILTNGLLSFAFGATLLMPFFLIVVYANLIMGIKELTGKIQYVDQEGTLPENTIPQNPIATS